MSAQGLRNMDRGNEKIEDSVELKQVRQQARRVHLQAVGMGIVLTVLLLVIPL